MSAIDSFAEPGEQRSVEWVMSRLGHLTASRMRDAMDTLKNGASSAKRSSYILDTAIERITNVPTEHFVSKPMLDGMEREPAAKMLYEARTGAMLIDVGFVHHKSLKWLGGSPDALVDDSGGLEVKAPTPPEHARTLLDGMPEVHHFQIQTLMFIFERQWWDFCSYSPVFPEPLQLYVQRIQRDENRIAEIESGSVKFLAEVAALVDRLQSIAKAA